MITIPSDGGNTFENATFTLNAAGDTSTVVTKDSEGTIVYDEDNTTDPTQLKVKLEFTAPIPITTVGQTLTNVTTGATGVIVVKDGGILTLDTLTAGAWANGDTIEFPNTDPVVLDNDPIWILTIPTAKKLKLAFLNVVSGASFGSDGKDNGVISNCVLRYGGQNPSLWIQDKSIVVIDVTGNGDGWTGLITAIADNSFDITFPKVGVGLDITGQMHLIEGNE